MSVARGDVYLLGNRPFGGVVQRYDVPANWTGETSPPLAERATVGPEIRNPAAVTEGPEGRIWIVSDDENRFAYSDWRLVESNYDTPLFSVFLGGMLILLPSVLLVILGLTLSVFFGREPDEWMLVGFASVPPAVLVRQALVPFPVTALYWLPDSIVAAVLAAPTAAAFLALRRRDYLDGSAMLRYVMLTAPLLLLAFDFLRAP